MIEEQKIVEYFGTNLDSAGHQFWKCKDNYLEGSKTWFRDLPFNPEDDSPIKPCYRGDVNFFYKEPYSVLRIEGSCIDTRGGCKSVFFTKDKLTGDEMMTLVLSIPIAKKIIDKMPFHLNFKPFPLDNALDK